MRELKFRYVLEKQGKIRLFVLSLIDCEIESQNYERFRQLITFEGWSIIDRNQYCNMCDKNGTELYEGDIVRDCFEPSEESDLHYLGPSKKGTIVWAGSHAGFYIETDRWDYEINIGKIVGPTTSHQIVSEWTEVIGNIYENPELIKGGEGDVLNNH